MGRRPIGIDDIIIRYNNMTRTCAQCGAPAAKGYKNTCMKCYQRNNYRRRAGKLIEEKSELLSKAVEVLAEEKTKPTIDKLAKKAEKSKVDTVYKLPSSKRSGVCNPTVPQDIQEQIVQSYIDYPEKYKDAESLIPVAYELGYKTRKEAIQAWKSFAAAQESRRNFQLDRAKNVVAESLEQQINDLTANLSFYSLQSKHIKDRMYKLEAGTTEYTSAVLSLEKIDKIYSSLHEKYITILKILNINNPSLKLDGDKLDSFEDLMSLLKGS